MTPLTNVRFLVTYIDSTTEVVYAAEISTGKDGTVTFMTGRKYPTYIEYGPTVEWTSIKVISPHAYRSVERA